MCVSVPRSLMESSRALQSSLQSKFHSWILSSDTVRVLKFNYFGCELSPQGLKKGGLVFIG